MRKSLIALLSLLFAFAGFLPAHAQVATRLELYSLDTSSYPTLSVVLDPFDSSGNYITGLSREAVTILEDNQPFVPDSLEDLQPGVRFALAFDPGPYFAYRDATAVSRYDKIYKILQEWASTHPDNLGDDLSLVPTAGEITAHLSKTSDFAAALKAYSPPLQVIKPSLDTLAKAFDTVMEASSNPEMKPVVLYISSPPAQEAVPALQNLTERAVSQHIRVDTWIVSSRDFFSTTGATALKDLAIQTGGQYVLFSWDEPLPGLETYLSPLRHAYKAVYASHIITPGSHTLAALVNVNGETLTSLPISFNLDVRPPNPILVSPPYQIVRQAPDERTQDTTRFTPAAQIIEVLVEFPDGRPRPLTQTALFVDNVKVAINTSEPFNKFVWDLSGYSESGQHYLSVEAVDAYGLRHTSIAVPVTITVVIPERGLLPFLSRNRTYVSIGAVIFAGTALGVILVTGHSRRKRFTRPSRMARTDPLTQPVVRQRKDRRWMRGAQRPPKEAEAYLVRIREDGQSLTAPPVPVVTPEMTFGSDPLQVTRILDDPSVSPLHARLKVENGVYTFYDEKSAAGTWVNYEPVIGPQPLQHGDLLQIGRVTYRFMLRKPPDKPAPRVTPVKR